MRSILLALLLALPVVAAAQPRDWKQGTWATASGAGLVTIETATDLVTARPSERDDSTAWAGTPGQEVRYAIERSTLTLLDAHDQEHTLLVTGTSPKYSADYAALGGGHYIKAVAAGGISVTLEDGTRWDIDARQHFAVAGWSADDLISIRRSTDDPAFVFEIDNTSQDDGALANRRVR